MFVEKLQFSIWFFMFAARHMGVRRVCMAYCWSTGVFFFKGAVDSCSTVSKGK